ncbi:hypothetical protein [Nonomuraea sp. NPDC050643]|uniref:hypothetical protein n=1 Tax=Nonomuraea sp. NPDC050643 TaxID=3155660 RepID=UPI0033F5151F
MDDLGGDWLRYQIAVQILHQPDTIVRPGLARLIVATVLIWHLLVGGAGRT